MRFPPGIEIVTCPQWGARKPKQGISTVPASNKTIFHQRMQEHADQSAARKAEEKNEQ